MKFVKKLCISLLILLLSLFCVCICQTKKSLAVGKYDNNYSNLGELAKQNYATVKNADDKTQYKKLNEYKSEAYTNWVGNDYAANNNQGKSYVNILCLEANNIGKSSNETTYANLYATINITGDEAVVKYYSGSKNGNEETFSHKYNKFLAYYAYMSEQNKNNGDIDETNDAPIRYAYYITFGHFFNDLYLNDSSIKSHFSSWSKDSAIFNTPDKLEWISQYPIWQNGNEYMNSNNLSINYNAKIYLYKSTGGQGRAVFFGQKELLPNLEVDKYISKVNNETVNPGPRNSKTDKWKKNNAPIINDGDIITYQIKIKNSGEAAAKNLTFVDKFNTTCFETIASNYCTISGATFKDNKISAYSTGEIKGTISKIPKGETATITVKLKVKRNLDLDESKYYENGAKIGDGEFVYDYVKVNLIKISIDKYITKVESVKNYGDTRANQDNSSKKQEPAILYEKGTKIYYKIIISNNGNGPVEVDYEDKHNDSLAESSGTFAASGIKLGKKGSNNDKKIYNIVLTYSSNDKTGLYGNRATAIAKNVKVSSEDWVKKADKTPPTINKYVYRVDKTYTEDRSSYTEIQKQNTPADGGENAKKKEIRYKIVIRNTREEAISGMVSDVVGNGMTLLGVYDTDNNIVDTNKVLEIGASSHKTLLVRVSLPKDTEPGIYENTAIFKYSEGGISKEISSKDYVEVRETTQDSPNSEGELWKYISNVSGGDNGSTMIGENRKDMPLETREIEPVEVSNGSLITYTIVAKNNVQYSNTSGKDGNQKTCANHSERNVLDMLICEDTWDSGLEFVSVSGSVKYEQTNSNSIKLTWENVSYGEEVTAEVTLKVVASDMTLRNLENRAHSLRYKYKNYNCSWSSSDGWQHPYEVKEGNLEIDEDFTHDYVRLLDPYIKGCVWDDVNKDGFRSENESIKSIIKENYRNISVKLWKADNNTLVATKMIDEDGNYSFGRVRKAKERSDGNNDEWFDVQTGQKFNTNDSTLQSYYITFEYNGECYNATEPISENGWNAREKFVEEGKGNYKNNSDAVEQNRAEFNNSLEIIANNKAFFDMDGTKTSKILAYDISLNENLQESKLKWDGNNLNVPNADWASNYRTSIDENRSITMIAKTYNFYVPEIDSTGNIDYLQHIDLGIYYRNDDADLKLSKDVVDADVTINNHETKYEFNGFGSVITDGNASYNYTSTHNVQDTAYRLSIYREDYEFRTDMYKSGTDTTIYDIVNENNRFKDYGRDNDLNVIITYKITAKNYSTEQMAVIREIVDYASKDLIFIDAHIGSVNGIELNHSNESTYQNVVQTSNKCEVQFITGEGISSKVLSPGESVDIYVRYRVDKTSEGYLKLFEENVDDTNINESKFNIAEIGAYSFYNMDGKTPSGHVDKNSNPANTSFDGDGNPISYDTINNIGFEDDTYETGIVIALRDLPNPPPENPNPVVEKYYYRNISGIVFEENLKNPNNRMVDGQLVGNGIMDGNEVDKRDIPAQNVLVKLYEVIRKNDNSEEYYVDTGLWYRTGADGKYYFGEKTEDISSGKPVNSQSNNESKNDCYLIHPGLYTVRFIYGDEADYLMTIDGNIIKYSGQDYQSTKYTEVGNAEDESEIVLPTVFEETNQIVSVAKDNEIRRLEVMEYSTTTTYLMDSVLKANNSLANIPNPTRLDYMAKDSNGKNKVEEAELLAQHTSMFADTKTFDMDIEYYNNYSIKEDRTIDGKYKLIQNFYYSIGNINFGIIERPKTKLQLMNDITEIKAITSDGNTLIDIIFDIIYEPVFNNDGVLTEIKHTAMINYNKSKGWDEVQVLNRLIPSNRQGFRYANIDSDLLQGMTISIKYRIAIANISEVDHLSSWLEESLEGNVLVNGTESTSMVGLKVHYSEPETQDAIVSKSDDNSVVIDKIYRQTREYNYKSNYLYQLLYSGDTNFDKSKIEYSSDIKGLTQADNGTKMYYYNEGAGNNQINFENTKGSSAVRKVYSYTNIVNKVQSNYKMGYYLGNVYYNGTISTINPEAKVETRVDQFIDYVDNDLVFKPEENIDSNGQIPYLTYTTREISEKGLLRDVSYEEGNNPVKGISDGEKYYYNEEEPNSNNNLAFNIEKAIGTKTYKGEVITLGVYKYLQPLGNSSFETINDIEHAVSLKPGDKYYDYDKSKTENVVNINSIGNPYNMDETTYNDELNKYLYVMDLKASRTLTNEIDLDGIILDNIAEIVKTSNTVGRKVYVSSANETAGYIGNTSKDPIESVNKPNSTTTLVDIAKIETDTDFTEYVTFSPPTGLTEEQAATKNVVENAENILLIIIPVTIIIVGSCYVIIQFAKRKKFYK